MQRKKIAYISGTRADFGLMTPVLKAIEQSPKLSLSVYATGMHLMPEFGGTVREVEKLFPKARKIEAVFEGDDPRSMATFTNRFLSGVFDVFNADKPDFVLTLGDRREMLDVATACLSWTIPTGHIHGGEKTGTVDEVARHAITKLSHMHFPATRESAERLKRLGEEEWRIHVVGAPALDVILHSELPSKEAVKQYTAINTGEFILVTQHPTSENWERAGIEMRETLEAVKSFNMPIVVIYPNADRGSGDIIAEIERERNNPLFRVFRSIPYEMFLAIERDAAVWVGNSSAALIESASFRTPIVNVGSRQKGRERGSNVIDAGHNQKEITSAILMSLHDVTYRGSLKGVLNPYGNGTASQKIVKVLENLEPSEKLLAKHITY